MPLHDVSDDDQMRASYSYNPQHMHAYQDHRTPPQQHGAVEESDAFKSNRHTDHNTIVTMSLRLGRFVALVVFSLAAAFTYAYVTKAKIVLTEVHTNGVSSKAKGFLDEVKREVSYYNALFGTIMFAGSKVFEVYNETLIFPTLYTYLHNCSLFPGDVPQRVHSKVKANAIFWGLKALIIFMNVGFASLYVGQSNLEVVKKAGTRRLTAGADLDELLTNNRVWETPANAAHSNVTDVLDTILRSAMTGSTAAVDADYQSCATPSGIMSVHDLDTASVSFGFASHDWSADVLRHGAVPKRSVRFTLAKFQQQADKIQQDSATWLNAELVATAHDLLAQGSAVLSASLGRPSPPIQSANSLVSLVEQTVKNVNASVAIDTSAQSTIEMELAVYDLSEDVAMVSFTVDVPIATTAVEGAAVLCGASSDACVYSHELNERLRPGISVLPYAAAASTVQHERNAAFVFGLGRTFKARASASSGTAPQEIVSLSFGKMAWRAAPLHVRHGVECAEASGCMGLSVPVSSKRGVVLVSVQALPMDHLLATPANPMHLITLNPVALPGAEGRLMTWDRVVRRNSIAFDVSAEASCTSALVDAHLRHVDANRLVLEAPLQAMYTSALLYLLQNGVYTEYADAFVTATSRRLALAASEPRVDIEIALPENSSIATFAGCGVMVLLAVFVIYFPTDRVKLSPNTTAAAQYVQILTDDLYPDIVHKKRLRFINGDVLFFNEYVVDSIVLHAKRNEKKKIYL